MTSTICGSGQYYKDEIFKIVRIDRLKRNVMTYIFVGDQERDIKEILYNLESKGSISAKDDKNLKEHFKNNYSLIMKHRTPKFKFIYQRIYADDSISAIRKKIFCFLSTQNDLIIEQNQELWVKLDNKTIKILGPIWTNITPEPSLYQKEIKPDYKKFVAKDGHSILIEQIVNINDQLLFDATNGLKFENNEIYLHKMEDEMEYLRNQGQKVDELIIDGYFQKYWPHALVDYDPDVIYKEMERMRNLIKAEDKLISFVQNVPVDESMFVGCRIIQILIHITNDYEHEFVDLLKIFNLFNLDEKTPFKRYKDVEWPAPDYHFYKPLIDTKVISEKQMKDWVSATKKVKDASNQVIKEIQYSVRGLTLKRYIYTLDGEPKYATINIHRNGNIEVRIAFKEKYAASMKDVYDALVDIGRLINKINEIDYRFRQIKIPKSVKLNAPQVTFDVSKNLLEFHGRTRLIMMDTINLVNIPDNFNYKEMNEFSNKYFTPFVSPILSKKNYEKEELLAKYKRVSYYSRMNLEYEFIHKTYQQNPNMPQQNVIALLHENYYAGRPIEDAIKVYKDWERKFGYMGSQGKARQTGIEIRIKHGKIHLNGSKSSYQLTNASMYIAKFLNIYFNQSQFLKKYQIKEIFSNELSKLENIENEINNTIINNTVPLNNVDFYNYGNTLGNIYANDEYINSNVVSNENVEEELQENVDPENFNREGYLAKDDEIDRNIRMQCDDRDTKRDVCTDFCEDEFYTLRRLQKYDNPIFRFRSDPRFKNYARQCQPQERQPLVLKNNPADNPKIDPNSYKNAVKYGSSPDRQNWYICAQVWCPYEEIPILYSKVEKNIKVRPTRKGNCLTAKCPSCLKEGRTTWVRIVETEKFNQYVGFIDDSNHPNHLCMPCCFKKPSDDPKAKGYSKFMKCLGKNVEGANNTEKGDYIMGRDKMPLTKGRLGLLPINIANLFQSRCETGKMPLNLKCHLRFGVKDDSRQSFLQAIVSIVEDAQPLNLTTIKKYLFETKLTKRLFNSLNNGELVAMFEHDKLSPMEHYVQYMMSETQNITEEFLWDYLQRPGILEKDGINIFILTSKSLLCPVGFNSKEFYDPTRKSIILYTDGRYYEPIYQVLNEKGQINLKKFFNPDDPEIVKLYNMAINNCISKDLVNWDKIRKNTLGNKYFEIKPQLTAKEVKERYREEIKGQVKDSYNKSFAFVSTEGYLLPFKPQGELTHVDIIENWHPKSLKLTLKFYDYVSRKYDLPYEPMRIYRKESGEIIAIQLENNSIIPVQPIKVTTELLMAPGKYYYNVDKFIAEGKEVIDERAKITLYIIYIQESYDRLRMELARKLQGTTEREKIIELLENKDTSKKEKRDVLKKIIEKFCRKITVVLDNLPFPIESYVKPKLRRTCAASKDKAKCLMNPHCYFIAGECKLIILKKSPVDGVKLFQFFMDKLTEELMRNKFLRDEILEDKLDEIINKSVEVRNDEIVIYGAKDLLQQVANLYKPKKEFTLKEDVLFSKVEPSYKGINKNKYLSTSSELTLDTLNLHTLPSYWKRFFGPKVRYYDDKSLTDSLYYALLRVLATISPQIKTVKSLKNLEIQKIEHLSKQNINKEPLFKNINSNMTNGVNRIIAIFKAMNGNLYKNINTITQLKEFIMSDEYPANSVDIYLLSEALGINIVVLEKRIKKSNQKGFYGFIYSLKKDYILLLEQQQNNKNIYSVIGKNGSYVFKKKDLPKNIKEFFGLKNSEE